MNLVPLFPPYVYILLFGFTIFLISIQRWSRLSKIVAVGVFVPAIFTPIWISFGFLPLPIPNVLVVRSYKPQQLIELYTFTLQFNLISLSITLFVSVVFIVLLTMPSKTHVTYISKLVDTEK